MLPMFKRAKVLPYLDTVAGCIDRFIDNHLAERDGQIHFDLVSKCQNVLLNAIALIAFDYDLEDAPQTDGFDLQKAFNDFVQNANRFVLLAVEYQLQ